MITKDTIRLAKYSAELSWPRLAAFASNTVLFFFLMNSTSVLCSRRILYQIRTLRKSEHRAKDWKICFFLVQEFGITSIPGTCFYGEDNKALGATYLRFGACKSDKDLELDATRLKSYNHIFLGKMISIWWIKISFISLEATWGFLWHVVRKYSCSFLIFFIKVFFQRRSTPEVTLRALGDLRALLRLKFFISTSS